MTETSRRERPISVVVPTRDRAELLEKCLATLRSSLRPVDELIVVDSASSTDDVRRVAEAAGARYIRCELPGTSRARNAGWRAATNDIIAFIDDDVRVDPEWATALARAFDDPGTTFVTGQIRWPPENMASGPVVAVMEDEQSFRLDSNTTGIIGHSANLAVRRQALEHIGGFDELLGPGVRFKAAEDLDLFDRLFNAGYVGRYEPSVSSYHETWRRIRQWVKLQGAYGFGTGARVVKQLRNDRRAGLRTARVAFVDWGFRPLGRALRRRDRTLIAGNTTRLACTASGFAVAMFYRVRDGHFGGRTYPT